MTFLEIKKVIFKYEDMSMEFSLSVEEGECLGILGPSGSGKSTLLSLIAGFDHPLSGYISLRGQDITAIPPQERGIAILFQDNNLFPHLSVAENVALGIKQSGDKSNLIQEALRRVGLEHLQHRKPGELSGGERQRVALARCLLSRASLLLLDEPFHALGPALKQEMLVLTDQLRREHGWTILLVSHDPKDIEAIGTKAAFVSEGRIVKAGSVQEVMSGDHPAIRTYLGRLPA